MDQQSTNRNNGRRREASIKPDQFRAQITHWYTTRQHQHQSQTPRVQTQKRKPGTPPRVAPSEVPM